MRIGNSRTAKTTNNTIIMLTLATFFHRGSIVMVAVPKVKANRISSLAFAGGGCTSPHRNRQMTRKVVQFNRISSPLACDKFGSPRACCDARYLQHLLTRQMTSNNDDDDNHVDFKNNGGNEIYNTFMDDVEHSNVISSIKSNTVKKIQNLLLKRKKRVEYKQTIMEGSRIIFDMLQNPSTRKYVRQILISIEEYDDKYQEKLMPYLQSSSTPSDEKIQIQLVTPQVLKACSDTVTPQGIVAVVDIPTNDPDQVLSPTETTTSADASTAGSPPPPTPLYLILDGVSDPGNLGTLLRSSVAVGVEGVILLANCCDVWNPKAVRSAMGTSFQVPIYDTTNMATTTGTPASNWKIALRQLHQWNVHHVYAATMIEAEEENDNKQYHNDDVDDGPYTSTSSASSIPHFDVDWLAHPTALIIGSEGNGLSQAVRQSLQQQESNILLPIDENIDINNRDVDDDIVTTTTTTKMVNMNIRAVHVPMQPGIESLNAAVCGSIILFEYSRQCHQNFQERKSVTKQNKTDQSIKKEN